MRALLVILAIAITLRAEDAPKYTVEQLQEQLAAKDQEIGKLNEQIAILGQRHDNLTRALNGCIGPLPQQAQPALTPQQRRMMQRKPEEAK
jgi:cell division protein FtsB